LKLCSGSEGRLGFIFVSIKAFQFDTSLDQAPGRIKVNINTVLKVNTHLKAVPNQREGPVR
jgi:hypothetical protein